jgi:peptide/nickel transport system substrate-binding protein
MLRGFRWQLLALVLAAIIFAASLVVRNQITPTPSPSTEVASTATPTPIVSTLESAQPAPTINAPSPAATTTGTFREGLIGQVGRLNPVFASTNPVDRDIAALIFEGLTRTNVYGEPQPLLAQSWVVSSDGLEYVFTLRNDVLWQDGTPFTSADVAYTMSILRDPNFPGDPGLGEFWRTIETEVLGTHIIRFRLTQPLGTFLDNLQIGILPEHALRGTNAQQLATHPFNLTPTGTGAYQLESIAISEETFGEEVRLRAAPAYRQRSAGAIVPSIDRLTFTLYPTFDDALAAMERGDIDALAASNTGERVRLTQLVEAGNLNLFTQTETTMGALIFNWAREDASFLREQRVRVALQSGLDKTSVIDRNLTNVAVPANSPLIPGSWAYLAELPWASYDPARAMSQLEIASTRRQATETATPEEGTTPAPSPSTYFSIPILVPDSPALIAVASEIATQWTQLNLDVTIEVVASDVYRERLASGDFVAALVEYSLGNSADPDVYPFWNQGQTPPDGLNYGTADDGRISELLERARREASGINRITLYHEFQQEFAERAIAIPLYYPLFTYVTSDRVAGVQLGFIGNPADRFRTLSNWSITSN